MSPSKIFYISSSELESKRLTKDDFQKENSSKKHKKEDYETELEEIKGQNLVNEEKRKNNQKIWLDKLLFAIKLLFIILIALFFLTNLIMYFSLIFLQSFGLYKEIELSFFKEVSLFVIGSVVGFFLDKFFPLENK